MHWLFTKCILTFLFCDATEISNMAAGGHSNMAAVGNDKIILWSPQNSLMIFTFEVV